MNKDSTGSDYRPRGTRTRKNKTVFMMILQAAAAFLIISCGIWYSIHATQTSSGPKQNAAGNASAGDASAGNVTSGNAPSGNAAAENGASEHDQTAGNEQTDSSDAPDINTVPGESTSNNAEPEPAAGAGQGELADKVDQGADDPDGNQEGTSAPKRENNDSKASKPLGSAAKLPTTYVIKEGDTLSTISLAFYHSKQHVALLAEQNHIVFINNMKVGDTIKIPALSSGAGTPEKQQDIDFSKVTLPVTYMVRADDTLYRIAMKFYQSQDYVDLIAKQNKLGATEDLKAGISLIIPAIPVTNKAGVNNRTGHTAIEHTVQQGETLSSIARKYFGSSKYAITIAKYNHLTDNDDVKFGDVLKIPPIKAP